MAHLYQHLRVHQIFGANTDVGKTIFSTALCLASSSVDSKVHYLKPVSTGAANDADDLHISTHSPTTSSTTLYQYSTPVSPHLAPSLESTSSPNHNQFPTSHELLSSISSHISKVSTSIPSTTTSSLYLETAGGVHSPSLSGESQSSLLRPLRLPTILIGSSQLGGISTTRSAYDSLLLSGYDVQAVLLFPAEKWGNVAYLRNWAEKEERSRGLRVFGLGGPNDEEGSWGEPPRRVDDKKQDRENMKKFYQGLVKGREARSGEEDQGGVKGVVEFLKQRHEKRIWELESLAERTRESCWWPFTQHMLAKSNEDVTVIDSAHGDFFSSYSKSSPVVNSNSNQDASLLHPLLDGSASWWTQCLGHSPERLTRAAVRASSRYGHVLFPMAANQPSLLLSERLLGKSKSESPSSTSSSSTPTSAPGSGWASRVFFSDDGSTGMEVALKMAIASTVQRYVNTDPESSASPSTSTSKSKEWEVLGLKGSYHGDTIGAMDACEGGTYNSAVQWYKGRGHWIEPPVVGIKDGISEISLDESESEEWKEVDFKKVEREQSKGKRFRVEYEDLSRIYDVQSRLEKDPLSKIYRDFIQSRLETLVKVQDRKFGALVLEPVVMGAGGMRFVDPLFQRILIEVVRDNEILFSKSSNFTSTSTSKGWKGLPIIFDEVFVGLYRLGKISTNQVLGISPDISVLAKILTGGLVPMSVTLASDQIFKTFSRNDEKVEALLHGHSYTAHAVGCEVALETLDAIQEMEKSKEWEKARLDWQVKEELESKDLDGIWSFWDQKKVMELSKCQRVEKVMSMGTVLALELRDEEGSGGYTSTASVSLLAKLRKSPSTYQAHPTQPNSQVEESLLPFSMHARPLGNVVYFMSSLNSEKKTLDMVLEVLLRELK